MRAHIICISIIAATVLSSCSKIPPIKIPDGVIDCATKNTTELVVDIINDVNSCLAAGKQNQCELPPPASPPETMCSWKKCLWDLTRIQTKAITVEALLC